MIKHMTVTDALAAADLAASQGSGADVEEALWHLAEAVRAGLAPLPDGMAEAMAADAERAARTMAPPVPGITRNGGYTVRSVIHMHDAVPGLLAEYLVACDDERGYWVTWHAYVMDGARAGRLTYDGGNYFQSLGGVGANRQAALADLAVRAGTMSGPSGVAARIAREVTRYHSALSPVPAEDRRMAARLLKWASR